MELTGTLTSRALEDDKNNFEVLVQKHHRQAYNVAYRMAGNQADAEDLTQEAFIRAFRFFDQYRRDLPFESWLYKIMSNVFVDRIRRKPKVHIRSLDQPFGNAEGEAYLEIPDDTFNPEKSLITKEMDNRIQTALASLPAIFRLTVIYADLEGLSYEEIADATRTNVGTVRSRLHRGRKMLREKLESSGYIADYTGGTL